MPIIYHKGGERRSEMEGEAGERMGRGGRERERIHSFGVADVQKFF